MTICVILKAQHQKAAVREPQPAKEEELQPAGDDFEIAFSDDESEQPVRPKPLLPADFDSSSPFSLRYVGVLQAIIL